MTAPITAAVPPRGSGRAGRPVVPLRPLGLGELLDGSVAVLRRYPRPVFAVSAVVAVLTGALQLVTSLVVLAPLRGTTAGGLAADSGALESFLGGTAVATVVSLLLSTLATAVLTGFVTIVVSRAVLEQGTTLREGWELLRPRIGRLLLTALALAGTTFGLVLLSFVALGGLVAALGGVGGALGALVVLAALGTAAWLYIRWSLATAAVVLEKTGVRVALKRSAVLARGDFWRILGVLLLTSKGAAAVTGGGFITLAATLSTLDGKVPVAGIVLVLAIDRFMSEARAITNLFGNSVATVFVAWWEGTLDIAQARRALNGEATGILIEEPAS